MNLHYKTACPDRYDILKPFAQENRNKPTEAEDVLWQRIRKKQLGYRFNRQHPVYDFIVDFVCFKKMLVIEVDGEYHNTASQQENDEYRTRVLEQMGFKIIRFANKEVLFDTDAVINKIREYLN